MKNVILADKAGFCFGVKRAVEIALNNREVSDKPIYTLGPLIHNNDVVEFLKSKDIQAIEVEDIASLSKEDTIIVRSHGVSSKIFDMLKDKNVIIADATCPYVSHIQQKVKKHYDMGYSIVIVGDTNHPEVIGINGWCNDKAIVSKDGSNIEKLPPKVCAVSQTTEKQENWEKVINVLARECKEIVAFNTICSATEVRQKAAYELSNKVDAMIVIGGPHSSNTTKLYEICKNNCSNTILVENAEQIPNEIVANSQNVGVTAGASTPNWIIEEIIKKVQE
jgi:4-hydroxy-3-methylbut-2-enyl diphosphate reductase